MKTINKFLLALTLIALTSLLYSCSDSPSSSEPSIVPEIEITNLSSSQLLSGEIELNINTSSPSHFKEVKIYLRDNEIQSLDPNVSTIDLSTWDFANGEAELKIEGITTDDESITSTFNVELENYVFQWRTDGLIDRLIEIEEVVRVDLLISDHTGNVIGDFDLFEFEDGLLQFLSPEELDFKWPESIAISQVQYGQLDFGGYTNTSVITSANITPGTIVDPDIFLSKITAKRAHRSFDYKNHSNLKNSLAELQKNTQIHELNSQQAKSVFLEIKEIDTQESLRIYVALSDGGATGGDVNTESYSQNVSYSGDDTWIVYAYSMDTNSNITPKYWIVEDVADTVSINYNESFTVLSTKKVTTSSNYERIRASAKVFFNDMTFSTIFIGLDDQQGILYYPSELETDMSEYRMTEIRNGKYHSNRFYGEMFEEVSEVLNVNFNIVDLTHSELVTNQSGDHDIFSLSDLYYVGNNYSNANFWQVTSSKDNSDIILPNIDPFIDARHSGFYRNNFNFNTFIFIGFNDFDENKSYVNYYFQNSTRLNHRTMSY